MAGILGDDVNLALRSMDGETASAILKRANDVLKTNRPVGNNHMTTHGSDWMWAVTALMAVLFLITLGLTLVTKHRQRVYHYLALALLLIPTITYFTMASNLGSTAIRTEFKQDGIQGRTRQVFWVRYIGWFITWPIIVLSLLLMTGVGWSTIIFTMGLSMLYAVMFLCGALTHSSFKWGYFVIALLALFLLAYQLLVAARPWARRFDTSKWYIPLAAYTLFFWCLYPISWGLSEGGNVISNDGEHVFYGILDIFSKGLFALALVFLAKQMDFKRLGLWMHDHGRLAPGYDDGTGRHEKLAHHPVQPGRDSGYDHDQYAGSGGARVTDTTTTTTTGV